MKCRVAKKIARHFWSRFLDPDNPRHRTSTVRKAVKIYNKQLKVKIKLEHNLPKFEWMGDDQVDPLSGLSFSATAIYLNGVLIDTCQHYNTTSGEKEENNE